MRREIAVFPRSPILSARVFVGDMARADSTYPSDLVFGLTSVTGRRWAAWFFKSFRHVRPETWRRMGRLNLRRMRNSPIKARHGRCLNLRVRAKLFAWAPFCIRGIANVRGFKGVCDHRVETRPFPRRRLGSFCLAALAPNMTYDHLCTEARFGCHVFELGQMGGPPRSCECSAVPAKSPASTTCNSRSL